MTDTAKQASPLWIPSPRAGHEDWCDSQYSYMTRYKCTCKAEPIAEPPPAEAALREEVERLRSELADALEELDVESNYSSCNYNSERAQRISALREGQKGSK